MARKLVLAPQKIASAQSLSASFQSQPTMVSFQDNCVYQINVLTSDSQGTFTIQGSVDYQPRTAEVSGNPGNWVDLSLGGDVLSVAAANDSMLIDLNQLPFNAIRVSYTASTPGTGIADIWVMCKTVGA